MRGVIWQSATVGPQTPSHQAIAHGFHHRPAMFRAKVVQAQAHVFTTNAVRHKKTGVNVPPIDVFITNGIVDINQSR
jgi:ABC-type xylose transport system permease subunit